MATYLRQKVKKSTSSSSSSTRYASELQEHGRKPIPDTAADDDYCSAADRARFLQNPAILDTLDSVHRSLLFNNLKFDTDEHTDGLDSTYTISREGVRKPSASYSRVPFSAPTTHVAEHDNKVNIAEASPDDRSSGTEVVLHEEELQYERGGGGGDCIAAANSYESLSLDDELAALFGRDWNNNLSGKAVASKVKMMVQQYERGKDGPVRTSAEHQTSVELRHPDVSSIGEAETSDFESASVTSGGSSVSGGDRGRRSVRTSSAFSEGSRDVASIERFELGAVNQLQRQQQEELAAGHNTMITININYRCDTNNPPRTSKATCEEEVGVGAKNVDIVVSAPPGQAAKEGGSRKSLCSDNAIEGATVERYVQAAVGGDVEEQELMDLEKEETEVTNGSVTNDSDAKGVELLPKDDAGTGSKMDHLAKERRRSSLTSNHHRPCYTPEDEEYHDCDDLHESTLSFYEQASSQPVTPQGQKQRSSPVECADALDGEQPMIRIVQELSEDHAEVTSTITLSKEQVREMQKTNGARRSGESVEELKRHSPREEKSSVHEKRRKSSTSSSNGAATATTTKKRHDRSNLQRQQRIMDDNFCNEILDSTIHFDRLLGNARSQRHQAFEREKIAVSSPSPPPARPAAEECFSDSVVGELVSSPADESFDSVMSVGKLEGKPRYSGKTVGRLMMKRLKKLQGGGRDVPPKTINTSDASTSSSLQTSGPKKPPRTFAANSPKRVSAALPTPSCPTAKDVEGSDPSEYEIGWKLDSKPRTHQVGWKVPAASGKSEAIPAQIYSMLNYSEDESRRRLIKTGNSKPAPQQQSTSSRGGTGTAKYWHDGEPAGPKLDIDTVDGVKTPSRRHSTSTDFEKFVRESNVKSTPHRKSDAGSRAGDTRRRIELFLSEERQQQQQQQGPERKLPGADRRRRTTGGIFERRRQQQENFLDDARRTNHEPRRRKKVSKLPSLVAGGSKHACCSAAANAAATASLTRGNGSVCSGGGKIEKRRTFRKAALLKRTRTLFEASKKKIWAIKKFETPKKLNIVSNGGGGSTAASPSDRDPNINRNSSVKKKNSLHHKHLGYTPVHLRCKTCGSGQTEANNRDEGEEDVVVPVKSRASAQQAAPAPRALSSNSSEEENKENRFVKNERRRRSGEEVNRKSARSLNFASVPQEKRLTSSPVDQNDREASPRKTGKQLTEPKFLKTLRNLKISPKRIFRFASHSSEAALNNASLDGENHGQGEFQSFDDLNLDSVANMGDFLSNIRKKIDGESFQQASAYRGQVAAVDVHDGGADQEDDDPIYQEISPKGNKMILNEFISRDTNKRYLMVNNNPNILYAMVEKGKSAGRLVRARSLTNVQGTASAADPTVSTTPVSKPLNNTVKSQMKPSNRRVTMSPHMERFDAVDMEESNCLYQTALTTNSTNVREGDSGLYRSALANSTTSTRDSIGRREPGRSLNATGSTSASSTRRSLFARHVPADRDRSDVVQRQQHQQLSATDESDISILQEEESGHDDEILLESRPDSVPIVREPLIVRERVEDRLSSVVRREDERFQQKPTGGTAAAGHRHRGSRREEEEQEEDVLLAFEKDIIVEEEMGGKNGKDGKGGNLILLKAHKSVQVKVEGGNGAAAPLGCFDTDGEIESLRKYNDREIEELVHSLHDNVTLSDVGTLDTETTASSSMGGNEIDHIGYDTVDLAPPPLRTLQKPASKNQTIDTVDVSELISHAPDDSLSSTSNLSPITGSLTSTKMSTTSGTAVMRNLKDKLRSSFRKSKTFIKNERQRLANYLEERTGSKSSSASSSAANSPRRRPVEQKNHFNTIGHTQSVQQSPARRRLECSEQEESDDMYRSFTDGSGSIVTAGSSMTELSSQHMSELMQQIIRQGDARKQLKQALGICRSTREFECSPELIEAERLLLVATQKETAVRNELNKIDYQTHGMTLAEGKRVGTVTLSNFEFPLKEAAVRDALFNYFYVVVCTYKHEVKATVAKERHADGRVYLRDCAIQFSNLDANYEIKVEVFVLQLRKNVKNYSFESRYHLEKDSKRPLSCPSPSKKLREAGRLLSFRSSSPKTFDFDNEFSRFKSQGFLTLTSFTLLTANGAAEGDDAPEEEKHFDATYATARTSHNTHLSTMLEGGDGDEEVLAEGHSYYSTTGHFQPVVCRRGDDQSVLFIAEEFKYLTLDSMAYTSNMVGTIGMSVRSEVRFDGSDIAGFLDVGEKVEGSDESITWNRRWCKMNGFMLEFWNYPQECQEKQPILYIDLVKCINERIQLADRTICSRPRTLKVEIFASRVAAGAGASCNSSGIGSFRSTTGRTTSPSCSAGDQDRDGLLRPLSPGEQQRGGGGGSTQSHNNVICYLLAADTQSDLKSWLVELNRVVKFLKEWKF